MPRPNKSVLRQAPIVLCQLLSPFTTQKTARAALESLLADPVLLDYVIECANRHFMVAALYEQLMVHGYEVPEKYRHLKEHVDAHHALPLYREGHDCHVELHYHPLNHKAAGLLHTTKVFESAELIKSPVLGSAKAVRLSPTDAVLHCFAHFEICHSNQEHDLLEIRQFDYFVRLLKKHSLRIDWKHLQDQLAKEGQLTAFAIYCEKVRRLFGWPERVPELLNICRRHA